MKLHACPVRLVLAVILYCVDSLMCEYVSFLKLNLSEGIAANPCLNSCIKAKICRGIYLQTFHSHHCNSIEILVRNWSFLDFSLVPAACFHGILIIISSAKGDFFVLLGIPQLS